MILVSSKSEVTIKDSEFIGNKAVLNGVIAASDYSRVTVDRSTFNGNLAVYQGVFKFSGESSFSFKASTFKANVAEKQNSVGQIVQVADGVSFSQCTFTENRASYSPGSQGSKAIEVQACT